jgi:hypothetical protein
MPPPTTAERANANAESGNARTWYFRTSDQQQ